MQVQLTKPNIFQKNMAIVVRTQTEVFWTREGETVFMCLSSDRSTNQMRRLYSVGLVSCNCKNLSTFLVLCSFSDRFHQPLPWRTWMFFFDPTWCQKVNVEMGQSRWKIYSLLRRKCRKCLIRSSSMVDPTVTVKQAVATSIAVLSPGLVQFDIKAELSVHRLNCNDLMVLVWRSFS